MKETTPAGIWEQLLGSPPLPFFLCFFWALVGVFILMQLHATTRDVKSVRTPVNFSWRIFFLDNIRRIFFNLALILVALRFSPEVMGWELTMWGGFLTGFLSDSIALILNQIKAIKLSGIYDKQKDGSK